MMDICPVSWDGFELHLAPLLAEEAKVEHVGLVQANTWVCLRIFQKEYPNTRAKRQNTIR